MRKWLTRDTALIVFIGFVLFAVFMLNSLKRDVKEAAEQIEYVTEVADAAIDTTVKSIRHFFENVDTATVNDLFREYATDAREFKTQITNAVKERLRETGGASVTFEGWRVLVFPGTVDEDEIKRRILIMDWPTVAVPDNIEIISIYTIATLGGKAAK